MRSLRLSDAQLKKPSSVPVSESLTRLARERRYVSARYVQTYLNDNA